MAHVHHHRDPARDVPWVDPDLVATTQELVAERFPRAVAALLGGSSAHGTATASSDLDVVVVLPGPPAPYRETVCHRGRPVELFVHTVDSVWSFVHAEIATRRSPLLHLCGASVLVVDHGGVGTDVQAEARRLIAAGPAALTARERDDRRYRITGLVEDLLDAGTDAEVAFIGAALLLAAGELVILEHRGWLGVGKWLARRLHQASPETADDLVVAYRRLAGKAGAQGFADAALRACAPSGGPLAEGYRRP